MDMVTRDKDDPRNNEEGERGHGGVRMVVEDDVANDDAQRWFWGKLLLRPDGHMFDEELSKMKVGSGLQGSH
jgi:hypothetical protein